MRYLTNLTTEDAILVLPSAALYPRILFSVLPFSVTFGDATNFRPTHSHCFNQLFRFLRQLPNMPPKRICLGRIKTVPERILVAGRRTGTLSTTMHTTTLFT
jgi:hypothetical protein